MRQTRVASRSWIVLAVLALLAVGTGAAWADNDARDYVAAPPGTFLMISYFKHTTASKLYNDGDKVSREFNLNQIVARSTGSLNPLVETSPSLGLPSPLRSPSRCASPAMIRHWGSITKGPSFV